MRGNFKQYESQSPIKQQEQEKQEELLARFTDYFRDGEEFVAMINPHGTFYYICSDSINLDDYERETGFCIVDRLNHYFGYTTGRGLYDVTAPVIGLVSSLGVWERDLPGYEKILLEMAEYGRNQFWYNLGNEFEGKFTANGCECHYLHNYYPRDRKESNNPIYGSINNLLFRFKAGDHPAPDVMAKLMAMAITREGIISNPNMTMLLVIPASTREKHDKRFRKFCEKLSDYLGIVNGYDVICIDYDREYGSVRRGTPLQANLSMLNYGKGLEGMHLLIVDDVYASGKSFADMTTYLSTVDAKKITGVFFAKSVDRLDKVIDCMKEVFADAPYGITHTMKVLENVREIIDRKKMTSDEILVAELSAILHDIGAAEAQRKHDSMEGLYQEAEGPAIAREILQRCGYDDDITDRVCHIVAHHHTPAAVDGADFRIVWDADLIENMQTMDDILSDQYKLHDYIRNNLTTHYGRKLARKRYNAIWPEECE